MKKVKNTLSALLIATSGMAMTACASALTYQNEVDIQFTFNPTLRVSLSSTDLVIPDLTPGNSKNSNAINVTIDTNNALGYQLSATVGDENHNSRNLVHTNGSSVFSSIDAGSSLTALSSDSTWGYSKDAGEHYSGLPLFSDTDNVEILASSEGAVENDVTSFLIGARAAYSQVLGTYSNVITFTAVTKINTDPENPTLQTITESQLSRLLPSAGSVIELEDERDGQTYRVGKLADGEYWFLDNLQFGNDGSNPLIFDCYDTNCGESEIKSMYMEHEFMFSEPFWDLYWGDVDLTYYSTDSDEEIILGKEGIHYNFCAATAGTYCYDEYYDMGGGVGGIDPAECYPGSEYWIEDPETGEGWCTDFGGGDPGGEGLGEVTYGDATYDICPAGWRLPTYYELSALNEAYDSNDSFALATKMEPIGDGTWQTWTSTTLDSNMVYINGRGESLYRSDGLPIRCKRAVEI